MNFDILNRNILLEKILQIKPKNKRCISNKTNKLNKYIKIIKKIGSKSRTAEVYKACFPLNCKYSIAVKQVPLTKIDLKYSKNKESKEAINKSFIWRELFYLKICNLLVNNNICPHLPLIYDYYICNNCTFTNKEIIKEFPKIKDCLLISNELAEGDLKHYLTNIKPSIKELKIVYFQIYLALYCIKKYFKIEHQDLHWGNVLYHKIPKGGYIKYIIQGKEILIPNIGYLFVLWDFEFSEIKNKIEPKGIYKGSGGIYEDYFRITSMLQKDSEQPNTEYDLLSKKLFYLMSRIKNPNDFILKYSLYLNEKYKPKNTIKIIAEFNTDKNIKIDDPKIKQYYVNK